MKDWKAHGTLMGDKVRKYDPAIPPSDDKIDLSNFPLKLAKLQEDVSKRGWSRFTISLSNEIRALHLAEVVHGPSWKALIADFDRKSHG